MEVEKVKTVEAGLKRVGCRRAERGAGGKRELTIRREMKSKARPRMW